jgi:hypothetical protein
VTKRICGRATRQAPEPSRDQIPYSQGGIHPYPSV